MLSSSYPLHSLHLLATKRCHSIPHRKNYSLSLGQLIRINRTSLCHLCIQKTTAKNLPHRRYHPPHHRCLSLHLHRLELRQRPLQPKQPSSKRNRRPPNHSPLANLPPHYKPQTKVRVIVIPSFTPLIFTH